MIAAEASERAADLRRAFDSGFVEPKAVVSNATEDFLAIEVGGDPYMLRLSEVAGFFVDKKLTPLPSGVAELRGVAGFRGAIVPVYDLAALLHYPQAQSARWVAIAAEAPIALAFASFEGHFRFAADAIASHDGADSHLRHTVRTEAFVRPVVNIPSVVAAIRAKAPTCGSK